MLEVIEDSKWKALTNRQQLRVFKLGPQTTLEQLVSLTNSIEPPFKGHWKLTPYLGNKIDEFKIHAQLCGCI